VVGFRQQRWRWWIPALAAGLALAPRAQAQAVNEAAAALVDRAFRNLYEDDYVQTLALASRARGGREMLRKLQITRKQSAPPGRALVRFLEPPAVRRTSILVIEHSGASDDHYVYLPALRRTVHLSSAQRADSFFGTDLAYEDMEPKKAADYQVRWLDGAEADADGCAVVEIRPRPDAESTYERMVSCIETERAVIRWTDFFRNGALHKRLEIDPQSVRRIGDRFIPFTIRVATPGRDSQTRVLTESYEILPGIPDRIFSAANLEAGDAERDRARAAETSRDPQPGEAAR